MSIAGLVRSELPDGTDFSRAIDGATSKEIRDALADVQILGADESTSRAEMCVTVLAAADFTTFMMGTRQRVTDKSGADLMGDYRMMRRELDRYRKAVRKELGTSSVTQT